MKHYGVTVSLPLRCGQKELLPARPVWVGMDEIAGCREKLTKIQMVFLPVRGLLRVDQAV
jgi:hypothetical protein